MVGACRVCCCCLWGGRMCAPRMRAPHVCQLKSHLVFCVCLLCLLWCVFGVSLVCHWCVFGVSLVGCTCFLGFLPWSPLPHPPYPTSHPHPALPLPPFTLHTHAFLSSPSSSPPTPCPPILTPTPARAPRRSETESAPPTVVDVSHEDPDKAHILKSTRYRSIS
jgi:hypothetical protein